MVVIYNSVLQFKAMSEYIMQIIYFIIDFVDTQLFGNNTMENLTTQFREVYLTSSVNETSTIQPECSLPGSITQKSCTNFVIFCLNIWSPLLKILSTLLQKYSFL